MRNRLPGYSISLDRKKQYVQSRLQIAPVGFASRWNAGAPRRQSRRLTRSVGHAHAASLTRAPGPGPGPASPAKASPRGGFSVGRVGRRVDRDDG